MLGEEGVGCIAFCPLAQGMLTDKYLNGIPQARGRPRASRWTRPAHRRGARHVRRLNDIAAGAGQSPGSAGPVVGAARRPGDVGADRREQREQLEANVAALNPAPLTDEELAAIDADAVDSGINLWERSSSS